MASEDHIRFEANFNQLDAFVAQAKAALEEQIARAVAMGAEGETLLRDLRSQYAQVAGPGAGPRETPQIEQASAALTRENALKQLGRQLDLQSVEAITAQNEALAAQETLRRSLMEAGIVKPSQAPGPLIVPQERRYTGYEQTVGQQVAQEEALARQRVAQEELNAQLQQARQATLEQQEAERELLNTTRLRLAAERQIAQARAAAASRAYEVGQVSGAAGRLVPDKAREALMAPPTGLSAAAAAQWGAADRALQRYNVALGEYSGLATRADITTEALNANVIRLGIAEAEASNELRAHGALTTEWLGALARGETTVAELGYQVGATTAKFAGWTAAAAGTYAVLGAFGEFAKGAIDSSNAVGQLKRTLDNLDTSKAAESIRQLSQDTDVSIKEAGDAVFQFSRTFHTLPEAVQAAHQGLSVLQLDNVALSDSVKLSTALHQQYGLSVSQLGSVYNMIAAAQREYNARISDMVPLLQKSSGAVRNAGGDLNQLIQLGSVALRLMPGLGGSQIGTALYRGAATFTRKDAAALVSQFGLGRDINPLTGQGNFTQLLADAIKESATLPLGRRQQLANLIFGPQYGGRAAALFGPQAASLLQQVAGPGPRGITPQATRGALQGELAIQLDQVRKQMEQFVYGLQRVGSALAQTGALQPLGLLLRSTVGALDALRGIVDVFNSLPGPLKTTLDYLVEFRVAMLLLTRTRLGASAPGAEALARVPGFGQITETRQRAALATGIRSGLQRVEADLQQTTSQLNTTAARQATLEEQRLILIRQAGGEANLTADELERSNVLRARIVALGVQGNELEAQLVAQQSRQEGLTAQMVGVTAINRDKRFSRGTIAAMTKATEADAGASVAASGGLAASDAAMARAIAAKQGLVGALGEDAASTGRLSEATRMLAAAGNRDALAAVAAEEATAAAAAETTATAGVMARLGGIGGGILGLASALDPLTVGLIALPFALSALSGGSDQANAATQKLNALLGKPVSSLDQFDQQTRQLGRLLRLQKNVFEKEVARILGEPPPGGTPPSPITTPRLRDVRGGFTQPGRTYIPGVGWEQTQAPQVQAQETQPPVLRNEALVRGRDQLSKNFRQEEEEFKRDAATLSKTESGRRKLDQEQQRLESAAQLAAAFTLHGHPTQIASILNTFYADLGKEATQAIQTNIKLTPGQRQFASQVAALAALTPAQGEQYISALDNSTRVFGTHNQQLSKAAATLAILVDQYRNNLGDPTSMQKLSQDLQQVTGAMNKAVQDWLDKAKLQPTNVGQMTDINRALAQAQQDRRLLQQMFAQMIAYARRTGQSIQAIRQLQDAEGQALAQVASEQQTAIQQGLSLIQSQAAAQTSTIRGISPESDIARAQSTLQGYRRALSYARAHGADAQTLNGLTQQLNDAQNSLFKSQVDNARAIVDAQGRLAQSSITGISPADDLARARAAIGSAQQLLAFDQSHGAGGAQILQDQAAVFDAQHSLNQAIFSYAQQVAQDLASFYQAEGALAQAQTTNPVTQARDQLKTDLQVLKTIKPTDYKTYQEYQTAVINQQAKIAQDRKNVTSQYVSVQEQSLQFELHTQQITDQQYIAGLEKLLKLKKLTLSQRQQILTEIFDVTHQTAVNLNVGQFKLPTTYEVRRSIQSALRRRIQAATGAAGPTPTGPPRDQPITNHVTMTVNVSKDVDLRKFSDALGHALGGTISGQAKAAGLI